MFGPPGAGKGTQSDNLAKNFNLFKISTGDLLREEINKKSELGIKIKYIIDEGKLASDEITNNLVSKIISDKKYFDRLIFDGYPRNLDQAKTLDVMIKKYNQKISCVMNLKVNEKVITKRILGRQVCSKCGIIFNEFYNPATKANHNCDTKFLLKRSDDNEETIINRIETYAKETLPILNYYRKQNLLYEIEGTGDISTIYKEICGIINSLDT